MTPEAFARWQDFATRMARTCYADAQEPDLDWIQAEISYFFDCLKAEEIHTFESWDHSGRYTRETGYFEDRQRGCRCRHQTEPPAPCIPHDAWLRAHDAGLECIAADAYVAWRHAGEPCTCTSHHDRHRRVPPDPDCPECNGDPEWWPMATGPCISDIVSEQASESRPCSPECAFCRLPNRYDACWQAIDAGLSETAAASYAEWRADPSPHRCRWGYRRHEGWFHCTCDEDRYAWEEAWLDQWFGPVSCCLRAGIDFASEPSAGVLGFTAGDIRRMYPEGVPDWVFPPGEKLHYAFTSPLVENGIFADLPDSASVLL